MDDSDYRRIMTAMIIVFLSALSFLLIKPLLMAIISGIILAFIFSPLYNWIHRKAKSKNLSASIILVLLFIIILVPIWFLTPIVIEQSIRLFISSQQVDFVTPLKSIFPSLFASEQFSTEVGIIFENFITRVTNYSSNFLSQIILNSPTLFLQFLVSAFTFFFVLRDKDSLLEYIKSLLPFSKETQQKLVDYSKSITISVIYGQVIIGIIQGILIGIGFFIFRIPNALFLTLLAVLAGIFPIIGTTIVWLPVVIFLFIGGNTFAGVGLIIFGLLSSSVDNLIRPILVSRKTRIHSSLILIGMIGGLFLFGILGFILGPLIIAYLLVILELYRKKKSPGLIIEPELCKT